MTFWAPERPGLIEMAFLEAMPTLHSTLAQFPLPLKCWSALMAEQGKIYYFYESGMLTSVKESWLSCCVYFSLPPLEDVLTLCLEHPPAPPG